MRVFLWLIRLEHVGSEAWLAARDCKSTCPRSCGSWSLLVASLGTTDPVSTLQAEYEMHWKETHTHTSHDNGSCLPFFTYSTWPFSIFSITFLSLFHGKVRQARLQRKISEVVTRKLPLTSRELLGRISQPLAALATQKMVPNMCKYCKSSTICGYKDCLGGVFYGCFRQKLISIVNCAMPFPWFWIQGPCC